MALGKYRWDDWFRRARFTLRKGVDYRCAQMSMAQQLRNAATHRGLRLSICEVPEGLLVQVVSRREEVKT